jgi:hypothetical protein
MISALDMGFPIVFENLSNMFDKFSDVPVKPVYVATDTRMPIGYVTILYITI